jgi:hypothetical protein
LTQVGAQDDDLIFWPKSAFEQAVGVKLLQPLTVQDVTLATGHILDPASIYKLNFKATAIEEFVERNPVDAGRLHNNRRDSTLLKPVSQPMEVGCERGELSDRLVTAVSRNSNEVGGRADINATSIRVSD